MDLGFCLRQLNLVSSDLWKAALTPYLGQGTQVVQATCQTTQKYQVIQNQRKPGFQQWEFSVKARLLAVGALHGAEGGSQEDLSQFRREGLTCLPGLRPVPQLGSSSSVDHQKQNQSPYPSPEPARLWIQQADLPCRHPVTANGSGRWETLLPLYLLSLYKKELHIFPGYFAFQHPAVPQSIHQVSL